ncbi:phage baseplate assembly protein V [Pseudomonas sp. zfem002]|uniref:phage baseplate assembly protein V n=1 Tax=Pseudomonas sp. zfem002 TaxID=3078197 RepID=UPI002927BE79|nr:phage baseplate assembly protein V [Pseudomonas sp. zfem002]MDU9391534.1 phage baseplate assembly protein V [Pseudomonas sp. zfem002]
MTAHRNFIVRGVLALVNAASKMQSVQMRLTAGELKDNVEHFEPYGITSNPHPGAEGVTLFVNGDRSHAITVCVADRRYRLQGLEGGEVAIYTDEKDFIHLKRNRTIAIETLQLEVKAGVAVDFDTPVIRTTGRIEAAGDVVAAGVSTSRHVHEGSDKKPVPED